MKGTRGHGHHHHVETWLDDPEYMVGHEFMDSAGHPYDMDYHGGELEHGSWSTDDYYDEGYYSASDSGSSFGGSFEDDFSSATGGMGGMGDDHLFSHDAPAD